MHSGSRFGTMGVGSNNCADCWDYVQNDESVPTMHFTFDN